MSERLRPKLHERVAGARLDPPRRAQRSCAWDGCEADGTYKAPLGRHALREYIWFCLEHVRAYNAHWDYFAGMSADQIDAHRRDDITWHRPTWQFAGRPRSDDGTHYRMHDPFGLFGEDADQPSAPPLDAKTREMMRVLDLQRGFSEHDLKTRYKALAKQHHPDLNGGSKQAEDMLKRVNEAYSHLRQQFA